MKGYRFYLEYASKADKRKGVHAGNVLALYTGEGIESAEVVARMRTYLFGVGGVLNSPDSPVGWTGEVSREQLRERFKRVSEQEARKVHPRLFEYLDAEEALNTERETKGR